MSYLAHREKKRGTKTIQSIATARTVATYVGNDQNGPRQCRKRPLLSRFLHHWITKTAHTEVQNGPALIGITCTYTVG